MKYFRLMCSQFTNKEEDVQWHG